MSALQSTYDWLSASIFPPDKPTNEEWSIGGMLHSALLGLESVATGARAIGVSGALAVGLGAYGAHVLRDQKDVTELRKNAFETGNRYHLIHTMALLISPLSRNPSITAGLFLSGIILFSGTCYHFGLTGNEGLRRFTPIGGLLLIAAWASLVF